ncbi:MAG TPA: peptide deformylase [Candidatus Deferrimicrobiaceae bacterium]|nr:peptide deformylase [Candidatus Deferrimicrobiaceae bacterium]
MQRPILTYPDPFLSTKALPVGVVDGKVRELIRDLFETMYAANGIGLAATQVGVGKRVIVVDLSPVDEEAGPIALVNPEVTVASGSVEGPEGCLSVPGLEGAVCRAETVVVRGKNEHGEPVTVEAHGLLARALQHEIDHLDGVLFIDKLAVPATSAK